MLAFTSIVAGAAVATGSTTGATEEEAGEAGTTTAVLEALTTGAAGWIVVVWMRVRVDLWFVLP